MREPDTAPATPESPGTCPDAKFTSRFPSIAEHLSATFYDNGKARLPSTLSIRVEEGEVRLALNDVDKSRSMFTAASTLDKGLEAMEKHLAATGGTWRPWKAKAGGKRG